MRRPASTASAAGVALLVTAMALVGCSGGNTDSAEGGNQPTNVLTPNGWELVWSDDYGATDVGMTMKIDCVFPCSSGDQGIGKVGDGAWETVEIPHPKTASRS